jgi:hypothetical protein
MSIDPTREVLIPFRDVPSIRWIPRRRGARKLHFSTVFRWFNPGVRGVRLEAIRAGGTLCTTEAALARFFAALAGTVSENSVASVTTQPQQSKRIERELDDAGL